MSQSVRIVFSHSRKPRPVSDLFKELSDFIEQNPVECLDPTVLVGKHVSHKFELEDTRETRWYCGKVISYDPATKTHEIAYESEDEHCHFDVMLDLLTGDMTILG